MDQTGKEANTLYISESSAILQRDREFNRRISQIDLKPFGYHLLDTLEKIDSNPPPPIYIEKYGADNAKQIAREAEISSWRFGLQTLYKAPDKKRYVEAFFYNTINSVRAGDEFTRLNGEIENVTPQDLFNETVIPDHVFVQMLKVHDRVFMEKSEAFNNDISGLLQEIKADIKDEELSARFEEKVPEINIVMIDGLTENMEGNWGLYDEEINRIKIAQQVPDRWLKHTLTHEIIHALEGKKILATKIDYDYPTNLPEHDIHITKGGLAIGNQFSWLNEAITQNITTEILNEEGSQYQSERDLLSLLLVSGSEPIDFSLFRKAYFEDYDPEQPKGKRMPQHQALIDTVDSAYTKGFLAKLNYYVTKHGDKQHPEVGVQATINAMKTDWRIIVNDIPTASKNS